MQSQQFALRLRRVLLLVTVAAIGAGSLQAQNPVQAVFAACPAITAVFTERDVQVSARFVGDSSKSPHPTLAGRDQSNVVEFVVDTLGVPEPGSFVRVHVTDSVLVGQLARSISRWQFSPGMASGCKVRQRVVAGVRW